MYNKAYFSEEITELSDVCIALIKHKVPSKKQTKIQP